MRSVFFVSLLCLVNVITFSQEAQLVLQGTEESRNIGFWPNKLELTTELQGIEVDKNHQIRLKEVTVVDDLGNQLQPLNGYPYPTDYFTKYKELVIGLEPPLREVHTIRVEGILEYFTIAEELQSKLRVTHLHQEYHKNLLTGMPSHAKLVLIDLEGLSKLKEENEIAYNEKVKTIHEKAGVRASAVEAKYFIDGILYNYHYAGESKNRGLYFYREDPKNQIVDITPLDKEGKSIIESSYARGNTYSFTLKKALTPETGLEIHLRNKAAIKEIPFQFKKIRLP